MNSRWSEDDVPAGLIFVAMATLALVSPAQSDTWTHLRAGREMWTTGELIRIERFSFTSAGVPWHNHEWLSQVVFYAVYALGGPLLLTVLTAGCAFLAALATWRTMRGGYELRLVLLALLVVLLPPAWAPRPQALSLLVFVLALQLAIRDRLEWLVPMMVIWANAHGVVLFGVLIAIGAAVDAVVWSRERQRRGAQVAHHHVDEHDERRELQKPVHPVRHAKAQHAPELARKQLNALRLGRRAPTRRWN